MRRPSAAGGCGHDPVDMATDAAARDGKAELFTIGTIALAGIEVEPRRPQPADRQILKLMADLEDPQRLAAEIRALILGRACELELQRAFAGMSQTGRAEIGSGRRGLPLGDQRGVDQRVDPLGHGGARVEIQHQNGISASAAISAISARNASTVRTISRCMSFWVSWPSGRFQPIRSISGASARITAGSA